MSLYKASRTPIFLSILLGPMLVIVGAVVAFPFFYNIVLSFSNANIYTIRNWKIIGFQQYLSVLSEPLLWQLLAKTIVWTVVNVFFHVVIGVALAVALHQKFIRGKAWWRIVLILPWALPQYITALTWRGMFNYDYGAINIVLTQWLKLPAVQWLGSPLEAFIAVIITNIWMGFPFMMVVALGGLQSIPDDLYEAAQIDGASAWQQFRNITLPLLKPVLAPAITLGTVWTFNNINVIWLVSNMGEPAESTHILVSYVYKAAFSMYRLGWAAALSMLIFLILVLFTQAFMRKARAAESVY